MLEGIATLTRAQARQIAGNVSADGAGAGGVEVGGVTA